MRENIKYSLFQGFYYTGFCTGQGFCAYYLSKYGYSFHSIGIITAISCLFASILQIVFGRLLDKSKRLNWKNTLVFFVFIYIISSISLYFTDDKIFTAIFMGIGIMIVNAITPVINSISFYYTNHGKNVNFGIARGIGSLSFALCSVFLGRLVLKRGFKMVPFTAFLMAVFMLFILLSMPYGKDEVKREDSKHKKISERENLLKKYPGFFMMAAGVTMFFTFHNMYCTYLINIVENAGGNTKDYGIAMAMAAICEIPVMFLSSGLVKRFSPVYLLILSGFSFALKGFIFLISKNMAMVYMAQGLQIVSYALIASVTVYFADESVKEQDKVTGQSVMTMAGAIGSVLGNFIGGFIISSSGIKMLLIYGILITFIGIALAFLSCFMLGRKKPNREVDIS